MKIIISQMHIIFFLFSEYVILTDTLLAYAIDFLLKRD